VLVGGFGTRLRPLTLARPKQMLPIADRPMLDWVVGRLAAFGIDEVVLSLGYRPDSFRKAYPDDCCAGVRLSYAVEDEPLDTGGAIRFAALSAGIHDTFVVLNGDVLTDLDLNALIGFHRDSRASATLHLVEVEDPSAFGVVVLDERGCVQRFVEKPPLAEAPSKLINAGTYVFEPEVLDRIAPSGRVSIERQVFPELAASGRLFAMPSNVYWLDTGTPALYLRANMDALSGQRGAPIDAIDASAIVAPAATVRSSVVGRGTQIADDAEVEGSVLFADVRVGRGARVIDSIIGNRARVGEGARVVACVIGDGVDIDASAVLESVRLPDPDAGA